MSMEVKQYIPVILISQKLQNYPMHPEEGTTGNIIFTINEIWNKPDDIQAHIERASKAPHFERFLAANLEFATMSIMGETLFELN